MIIPIKTKPSKTLSRVEKRFFFFLDREAFSLGCLLGAGVGSDGLGEIFSQDLLMKLNQPLAGS